MYCCCNNCTCSANFSEVKRQNPQMFSLLDVWLKAVHIISRPSANIDDFCFIVLNILKMMAWSRWKLSAWKFMRKVAKCQTAPLTFRPRAWPGPHSSQPPTMHKLHFAFKIWRGINIWMISQCWPNYTGSFIVVLLLGKGIYKKVMQMQTDLDFHFSSLCAQHHPRHLYQPI